VDDYVVHSEHGIGIYRGCGNSSWERRSMTSFSWNTRTGDKLYLLVYRLNLLQKYVG
jgi:transcription-repair coupling factor (superfamily II helicase)